MGLADKVCIITGGGDGIGKVTALMMACEGAKMALVGRTASKVEAVEADGGPPMPSEQTSPTGMPFSGWPSPSWTAMGASTFS